MIARELELSLILERRQIAFEGYGQVVWIHGEAGIGKSRLLKAFLDLCQDMRLPVWRAVGNRVGRKKVNRSSLVRSFGLLINDFAPIRLR